MPPLLPASFCAHPLLPFYRAVSLADRHFVGWTSTDDGGRRRRAVWLTFGLVTELYETCHWLFITLQANGAQLDGAALPLP